MKQHNSYNTSNKNDESHINPFDKKSNKHIINIFELEKKMVLLAKISNNFFQCFTDLAYNVNFKVDDKIGEILQQNAFCISSEITGFKLKVSPKDNCDIEPYLTEWLPIDEKNVIAIISLVINNRNCTIIVHKFINLYKFEDMENKYSESEKIHLETFVANLNSLVNLIKSIGHLSKLQIAHQIMFANKMAQINKQNCVNKDNVLVIFKLKSHEIIESEEKLVSMFPENSYEINSHTQLIQSNIACDTLYCYGLALMSEKIPYNPHIVKSFLTGETKYYIINASGTLHSPTYESNLCITCLQHSKFIMYACKDNKPLKITLENISDFDFFFNKNGIIPPQNIDSVNIPENLIPYTNETLTEFVDKKKKISITMLLINKLKKLKIPKCLMVYMITNYY
jgi:hypothetical protein